MASGTTYQALKRLSYLPEREALDNGHIIGGQDYNDVYFIGGSFANGIFTNATINGISYAPTKRIITAGNVTVLTTDNIIIIRKVTGSATAVTLPASPGNSQTLVIKDGKGDANVNNITISGNGNLIDGAPTLIIGSIRGWSWLFWDGNIWDIIG